MQRRTVIGLLLSLLLLATLAGALTVSARSSEPDRALLLVAIPDDDARTSLELAGWPVAAEANIGITDSIITISWTHDAKNSRYELHRSDAPYSSPDPTTLLATLDPPFDPTIEYEDASAALGDSQANHYYTILSFNDDGVSVASNPIAEFDFGDSEIPVYSYTIINTYLHDDEAFTQGLVYEDTDILYEGTGLYGQSKLRKVSLQTGDVLQEISLDSQYFGEGITTWVDEIVQLTWRENTGFVYDKASFAELDQFSYPHQGWGITHDGAHLIVSDGTSTIRFWDPDAYTEVSRISVYDNNGPVANLNELEYIDGEIYANVWYSNPEVIARINPFTGRVVGWIDLSGLKELQSAGANVLNGIAYDAATDRLFVTGKLWSFLYEIDLLPPAQS